jgi:hypothetical protein
VSIFSFLRKDKPVSYIDDLKAIAADVKAKADDLIAALPVLEAKYEADVAKATAEAEAEIAKVTADLTAVRDTLAANKPATPAAPASSDPAQPAV